MVIVCREVEEKSSHDHSMSKLLWPFLDCPTKPKVIIIPNIVNLIASLKELDIQMKVKKAGQTV